MTGFIKFIDEKSLGDYKENVSFKVTDLNMQNESTNKEEINAVTNQSDPLIGQVLFFAKMFEKYVEDDKKKEENNNNEMNDNTSDLSSTDKMKEVIANIIVSLWLFCFLQKNGWGRTCQPVHQGECFQGAIPRRIHQEVQPSGQAL